MKPSHDSQGEFPSEGIIYKPHHHTSPQHNLLVPIKLLNRGIRGSPTDMNFFLSCLKQIQSLAW
jgi:hypothetical protein